jgi:CoA:oxalate CoA-transferase
VTRVGQDCGTRWPMSGVRIIDLSRVYSGPYATFLMAMAGAEVIKVEPLEGESLRRRNAKKASAYPFAMLNANKRSVTLDLKSDEGREALLALLPTADVLVENFRPSVMARLGLGDDVLRAANPRLIRASISGYGSSGPNRDYPAMDLTIQAVAGIMDATGFPDQPPVKTGAAIADFSAGAHLYGAVAAALFHRERTGSAGPVEVAMQDVAYPTLCSCFALAMEDADGEHVARTGNRHSGLSLCPYNVYPAADGYIAIICNNENHWRRLLGVIGRENDLGRNPAYATMHGRVAAMDYIDAEIGKATLLIARDELFQRLNEAGVPCGAVRTFREVMADPQMHATGMLREFDHPIYGSLVLCQSPIGYAEGRVPYRPSAELGADNDAVFRDELGINPISDRPMPVRQAS